ncbi:MAG: N-acetyltransferase [Deltaproteobacteria bacterium]|nr:N-acetyltransferase [Deltaproteobacteria bacterium]
MELADFFVHPTAVIDDGAVIGAGTRVWHFCHVSAGARIGARCNLGQNVFVGPGVVIGSNVKIQNNVSVYPGVTMEDDVFLGPSCVLTNVTNPRSQVVRHDIYEKTLLRRGCTIGANATVVCGITIGRYAFVAAGAVVAKDAPDYAMMVGVPARQEGFVSRHGHRLDFGDDGMAVCPESGFRYHLTSDVRGRRSEVGGSGPCVVRCVDLDEESPLPATLLRGTKTYDEFKG